MFMHIPCIKLLTIHKQNVLHGNTSYLLAVRLESCYLRIPRDIVSRLTMILWFHRNIHICVELKGVYILFKHFQFNRIPKQTNIQYDRILLGHADTYILSLQSLFLILLPMTSVVKVDNKLASHFLSNKIKLHCVFQLLLFVVGVMNGLPNRERLSYFTNSSIIHNLYIYILKYCYIHDISIVLSNYLLIGLDC